MKCSVHYCQVISSALHKIRLEEIFFEFNNYESPGDLGTKLPNRGCHDESAAAFPLTKTRRSTSKLLISFCLRGGHQTHLPDTNYCVPAWKNNCSATHVLSRGGGEEGLFPERRSVQQL